MHNGAVWIPLLPLQEAARFVPLMEKVRRIVEIDYQQWLDRENAEFARRSGPITSTLGRTPEEARGVVLNSKL